jgi:hypothetical protein
VAGLLLAALGIVFALLNIVAYLYGRLQSRRGSLDD